MSLRFHEIGEGDVESVVALWERCGLTRPWNDPRKDIDFARQGPSSTILVCGEIPMTASVMVGHDGHRGMLYYVAVDPEHRRRGLGRTAVRAAEAWLGERGVWKVNLLIRPENDAVKAFYEKLGYEVNPVFAMARRI